MPRAQRAESDGCDGHQRYSLFAILDSKGKRILTGAEASAGLAWVVRDPWIEFAPSAEEHRVPTGANRYFQVDR